MAFQNLKVINLKKKIITFGLIGATPPFYPICIAQSCNDRTYKLGIKHPNFISCAFPNHLMRKNSKVLEEKLFLKEVQSAITSIINYVLDLT
jgi:hypothetical protein